MMTRLLLVLVMVGFVFAQFPPPTDLSATSNLDSEVPLSWSAPIPPRVPTVISYDDDSPSGFDPGERNDILSVRFTPSSPCSLVAFQFRAYVAIGGTPVHFRVLPDDGGGHPNIYGTDFITPIDTTLDDPYVWVEIETPATYIDEDFHICMQKIANTDSFPHGILMDSSPQEPPRSYQYDYDHFGYYAMDGDLLIRAVVVYPTLVRAGGRRVYTLSTFDSSDRVMHQKPLLSDPPTMLAILPSDYISDPTEYRIYRGTTPSETYLSFIASTTDLFYTDATVTNDVTYYYGVKAVYDGGTSIMSNVVAATPRGSGAITTLDTIGYDSGIPTGAVSWAPGTRLAIRLTATYPALLTKLLFNFQFAGQYKPAIYSYDGALPDSEIYEWPFYRTASADGWNSVNTEALNIIVLGDFVAACNIGDASVGLRFTEGASTRSFEYNGSWYGLSDTTYMIRAVLEHRSDEAYFVIKRGWNMVSLPVVPDDPSVGALFPTIVGGDVAYRYDGGSGIYIEETTLQPGYGYFILSDRDTSYTITGTPVVSFDVPVYSGWNMIGATNDYPLRSVDDITTIPDGIWHLLGYLYWYNAGEGYETITDYLVPTRAYWFAASGDGVVRITTTY